MNSEEVEHDKVEVQHDKGVVQRIIFPLLLGRFVRANEQKDIHDIEAERHFKQQWGRDSEDPTLKAEQHKIFDKIYQEKEEARIMAEQAEEEKRSGKGAPGPA